MNATAVIFDLTDSVINFVHSLTQPLVPYHILSTVPIDQWENQVPIGYGPYKFQSLYYSNVNYTLKLEKWDNNSAILGTPEPTINEIELFFPYNMLAQATSFNYQEILFNAQKELLENGTIDMFITNWPTPPNNFVYTYNATSNNSILYSYPRPFSQGIEYNLGSPIWGMNPINPAIYLNSTSIITTTSTTTEYLTTISQNIITTTVSSRFSSISTNSTSFGEISFILSVFIVISVVRVARKKNN